MKYYIQIYQPLVPIMTMTATVVLRTTSLTLNTDRHLTQDANRTLSSPSSPP